MQGASPRARTPRQSQAFTLGTAVRIHRRRARHAVPGAIHLFFLEVFGGSLASSSHFGHSRPAMTVWASRALAVTAAPIIVWRWTVRQEKRNTQPALGDDKK
ncbi:hypothetical protein SVIO_046160 [Streptomyces violaceusniger]|uniref:Uncharacterized protein n=1 Tax=Streptomyces violaceusniger TaxID=68280 RepID=A0A4D4L7L0_STRVO|nr:hypothetical protein SVIO_046160 [Streptomyces violaceusniger]